MAKLEVFDHSLIENYLIINGLHYKCDSDGDFVLEFALSGTVGYTIIIYLIIEGERKQFYVIRALSDIRFSRDKWSQALNTCNEWNKSCRWPKAFLYIEDPEKAAVGSIVLEQQIDLEHGVHQELVNDFTNAVVSGSLKFWEWSLASQIF